MNISGTGGKSLIEVRRLLICILTSSPDANDIFISEIPLNKRNMERTTAAFRLS